MMYGSWDIKHNRQFFVILGYFLPFYPHNNPENQKFEKMKKPSWDIFMLHMSKIIWCMIPEIWNATDKIFLILDQFLSFNRFPPLNNPKNQNFENLKKTLEISSFYTNVPKIMVIGYTVSEIRHVTDVGYFLPFYLP